MVEICFQGEVKERGGERVKFLVEIYSKREVGESLRERIDVLVKDISK